MHRRDLLWALGGAASAALASCAAPYTVVRLAAPDPLLGRARVMLEPLRYDALRVQHEAESAWLAQRDGLQVSGYLNARAALAAGFRREVVAGNPRVAFERGPAAGDARVVRAYLTALDPGLYSRFEHRNAEANISVQVLSAAGELFDEVQLATVVVASAYHPSTLERLELAGAALGRGCAEFLRDRIRGARA